MKNHLRTILAALALVAAGCLTATAQSAAKQPATQAQQSAVAPKAAAQDKTQPQQSAAAPRPADLRTSRDSLLRALAALPEASPEARTPAARQSRIDILTNLADVTLALSGDKSALAQLWDEGIRQHNPDAIINAGRALTLEYLNRAQLDSADVWMARCRTSFSGPLAQPVLKYLQLMRDIRDMGNQADMARRLIDEQLHISPTADPYHRMTILYKLGTLALTEWDNNEKIDMKSWDSYMEEGYRIALTLPFMESYNFRYQFLMTLSFVNLDYTQQFIKAAQDYRALPQMKNRPFLSRRGEIVGAARMFAKGDQLGREEVERWYRRFCDLTTRYPHDCQMPYQVYFYERSISYFQYMGNHEKVIDCCDSVIVNAPKYKLTNTWPYQLRGETLGRMGRWQEAYQNSVTWMAVKDSLANVSSQTKLMELQTQYDVDRLQYQTQVSRERSYAALTVALLLLVALGIYAVYSRRLLKKNRELVSRIRKQEEAEEQAEAAEEQATAAAEAQVAAQAQTATPTPILTPEEQLFRRIRQLLKDPEIFGNPNLRREDLAELLGTNATYVAAAIRNGTDGLNVSEYINRKRVRHARYLFEIEPDSTIDQVADLCGFASRSRFHNAFKEQYDMTPGEFRKAIQKK